MLIIINYSSKVRLNDIFNETNLIIDDICNLSLIYFKNICNQFLKYEDFWRYKYSFFLIWTHQSI